MTDKEPFRTLYWENDSLFLLDQTRLPREEIYRRYTTCADAAQAIRSMVVRGAPAIGIAAAYGAALAAREISAKTGAEFTERLQPYFHQLAETRPTAVNLFWAIERMKQLGLKLGTAPTFDLASARAAFVREAKAIHDDDIAANRRMGQLAQQFVPHKAKILTHCNAGALATGGYGTDSLGVIYAAHEAGKKVHVFSDETRPFLQGARLTCWELQKYGVPVTLICDNMAGHIMKTEKIDLVVVGADRIAANGDVANKIGTYGVALLAREHGIPFYVAAPLSTLDLKTPDGAHIPIEERAASEVTDTAMIPGLSVRNPAFDISPHHLITAIITERGIAQAPYNQSLKNLAGV